MKKFKSKEHLKNYRRYHLPGCSAVKSIKTNIIYLNRHNSIIHERKKLDLAWDSAIYITEAARKATEEEKAMFNVTSEMVIDFVDLTTMLEWQIIFRHESDKQIAFYRKKGTCVSIVGDTITCIECKQVYPKRNKGSICQICKNEVKNEFKQISR